MFLGGRWHDISSLQIKGTYYEYDLSLRMSTLITRWGGIYQISPLWRYTFIPLSILSSLAGSHYMSSSHLESGVSWGWNIYINYFEFFFIDLFILPHLFIYSIIYYIHMDWAGHQQTVLHLTQKMDGWVVGWMKAFLQLTTEIVTTSTCPHENLYVNVHSNIFHNSQKVETTQMSINWQMDRQNVI